MVLRVAVSVASGRMLGVYGVMMTLLVVGCDVPVDSSADDGVSTADSPLRSRRRVPAPPPPAACPQSGTQRCTIAGISTSCVPTTWGFEAAEGRFWLNNDDNASQITTSRPRTGAQSLSVTPNSIPSQAASVGTFACVDASGINIGTLDLRGKTFTAFVFVPPSPGSFFTGTSCRLRANDLSFTTTNLGPASVLSPIPQGTYFKLTGTFLSTALESRISEISVDCTLPVDWRLDDPTKTWFVDDVRID